MKIELCNPSKEIQMPKHNFHPKIPTKTEIEEFERKREIVISFKIPKWIRRLTNDKTQCNHS